MTVHAVVSAGADHCALDALELAQLQWEQFQHDEKYHREIARLTVHDRWKHMALHFAKYAGNLMGDPENPVRLQRTVVDTFVIALSTANTLNLRAEDALASSVVAATTSSDFLKQLVLGSGRIAAPCEKLDHVEAFPFREEIMGAVSDLIAASVTFASSQNWNLAALVRERLSAVKSKSLFHTKFLQE